VTLPFAVILIVPMCLLAAILGVNLRGADNNILTQIGLVVLIALAAKNAILIVEFAVTAEKRGVAPFDAAMQAARTRLRPILMTSLAFIAGVFPLAIATGAGAGSQNDIGTGVIGGMLAATILAIFFVPIFFVLVRGGLKTLRPPPPAPTPQAEPAP
jgi:multidrug efflux pump